MIWKIHTRGTMHPQGKPDKDTKAMGVPGPTEVAISWLWKFVMY